MQHMKRNDSYGDGYFFRSWSFTRRGPDQLQVMMEDQDHALAMLLTHNEKVITAIDARWHRHPLSSCGGAGAMLATMVGCPITRDIQALGLIADARSHCTHMFDTFRLGVLHAAQSRPDRRYDVVIPDTLDGNRHIELMINGELVSALEIDEHAQIIKPMELAGAPLLNGFSRWAASRDFSSEQYELMFFIQRATFVSLGRQIDMAYYFNKPANLSGPAEDICFGAKPERYASAHRVPSSRFDLKIEEALQFRFEEL